MIEVVISPAHIPAGSDADLNIRLTNVGQGTCTNVIFSVRLPATIMRLGGRNKIEAARLGHGEFCYPCRSAFGPAGKGGSS